MVDQRRISSCVVCGRIMPLTVPYYLQEIRTATAGEICLRDWQCFGPLYSMSQWADSNIVGHLPTESIQGLFSFSYMHWLDFTRDS